MDNYTAVGICEGFVDSDDEEQQIEAWQHLIDTGLTCTLQGAFGRMAQRLIDEGVCQYD
jgi:hypothetical protein